MVASSLQSAWNPFHLATCFKERHLRRFLEDPPGPFEISNAKLSRQVQRLGYDPELLRSASLSCRNNGCSDRRAMMHTYRLLDDHSRGYLPTLDFQGIFLQSEKPDRRGSLDSRQFSVVPTWSMGGGDLPDCYWSRQVLHPPEDPVLQDRFPLWMDSCLGLTLAAGDPQQLRLCGVVGFHLRDDGMLYVDQLQGKHCRRYDPRTGEKSIHRSLDASSIRLHELLLRLAIDYAKARALPGVVVIGAANNRWIHVIHEDGPDKGLPHLSLERALRIYDDTAERLGCAKTENGNWVREL